MAKVKIVPNKPAADGADSVLGQPEPQPGAPALDASVSPPPPGLVAVTREEFDALKARVDALAALAWQHWGKRV